jgi:hypothetical protein
MAKLKARPWAKHPLVELAKGDVLDFEALQEAAQGPTGRRQGGT